MLPFLNISGHCIGGHYGLAIQRRRDTFALPPMPVRGSCGKFTIKRVPVEHGRGQITDVESTSNILVGQGNMVGTAASLT
ncbi:MAG: hypothetical protein NTY19_22510 [Planctomycetota bacterium]|nr:hypothetical protein [Planctomycetota bacterium]